MNVIKTSADELQNPTLLEIVDPENDLKNWLVEYVGQKLNPEDDNVNVEMIIEVFASEFPELLLAIAEENYFRGYAQGLEDSTAPQVEGCGNTKCTKKQ